MVLVQALERSSSTDFDDPKVDLGKAEPSRFRWPC
jgi:hypothetical protein